MNNNSRSHLFIIDLIIFIFSYFAGILIRYHDYHSYQYALLEYMDGMNLIAVLLIAVIYTLMYIFRGGRKNWKLGEDPLEQISIVFKNHLTVLTVLLASLYLIRRGAYLSRSLLFMSFGFSFVVDVIVRERIRIRNERAELSLIAASDNNQSDHWVPADEHKKNLLIYAHYYVPDVASTGQILRELAEGLLDTFNVYVICTVPSYGGTVSPQYKTRKYYRENIGGVNVLRISVPEFSKSRKFSRIWNLTVYFFRAAMAAGKIGKADYIFTISQPPILGGILGRIGKRQNYGNAKLIYNIQDFNPEQIEAVGYFHNQTAIRILKKTDCRNCEKSDLVVVVGRDLADTLKNRFKGKTVPKYEVINNWVDEKTLYPLERTEEHVAAFLKKYGLTGKFVIMYSGNIGLYYDLPNLLKVIEKIPKDLHSADGREVVYAFVGGGSVLDDLILYKGKHQMTNVVFIPYQDKKDLIFSLNAADVHFCVNAKGIKGVSCPSKCYGIMAVGKPVLGVLEEGSEIRCIVEESGCGVCCDPEDYESIKNEILTFISMDPDHLSAMGNAGRSFLEQHLTKDVSISRYKKAILDLDQKS